LSDSHSSDPFLSDPHDLQRFVDAQEGVYGDVVKELRSGAKRSHWMWFIFPQIAGLGRSAMAMKYAIASAEEAIAYLNHPALGPRLIEGTQLVLAVEGRSIHRILGSPDDMKFCSSMTLFAHTADDSAIFREAIAKYYAGRFDPATLEILRMVPAAPRPGT
jgi:uncharacterized protein (DUF1810 family)